MRFQPTPPVGAETRQQPGPGPGRYAISTHSARGGGDLGTDRHHKARTDFNPLRPWGRRRKPTPRTAPPGIFQPTPPVGAETRSPSHALWPCPISTHSARGGGDPKCWTTSPPRAEFQPTPPVGAETGRPRRCIRRHYNFNPLRPWGRRPLSPLSPRPPRQISTHSARGGGDEKADLIRFHTSDFNPLRPWGRRPEQRHIGAAGGIYFNPLRPWGRRRRALWDFSVEFPFQPTPPVGAETRALAPRSAAPSFQPTPPVGAET